MRRSAVAMAMKIRRNATAPTVPQTRPTNWWRGGSVRTASAMTSALSPARGRSMRMMPARRAQNSGSRRKAIGARSVPDQTEEGHHDLAEEQQGHGNGEALVFADSHLVSPTREQTSARAVE